MYSGLDMPALMPQGYVPMVASDPECLTRFPGCMFQWAKYPAGERQRPAGASRGAAPARNILQPRIRAAAAMRIEKTRATTGSISSTIHTWARFGQRSSERPSGTHLRARCPPHRGRKRLIGSLRNLAVASDDGLCIPVRSLPTESMRGAQR